MKNVLRLVLCACLLVSMSVHAVRSVKWDKTPVRINLMVGVEQMIHFPADGQLGLPLSLSHQDIFTSLFVSKTAYWTALQPFDAQRIKVRLTTGEFILFDVSAIDDGAPPETVEPMNVVIVGGNDTTLSTESDEEYQDKATIFDLIRYATQKTYSPVRLIEPLPGIREVPVGTIGNLNALYNHQRHQGLIFAPNKGWGVDGLYVTAVTVINSHTHAVTLDNRLVQHTKNANIHGVDQHFVASSFYRNSLSKSGEKGDRTTLFIVTNQPFQSALRLGPNP